jgi:hypothetical protein
MSLDHRAIEEAFSRAKFATPEDHGLLLVAIAKLRDYERGTRMLAIDTPHGPWKVAVRLYEHGEVQHIFYIDTERQRSEMLSWLAGNKPLSSIAQALVDKLFAPETTPASPEV